MNRKGRRKQPYTGTRFQLTWSVDRELLAQIEAYAERQGTSRAAAMAYLLKRGLDVIAKDRAA